MQCLAIRSKILICALARLVRRFRRLCSILYQPKLKRRAASRLRDPVRIEPSSAMGNKVPLTDELSK
jgi:hypothetical protein